MTLRTRAALTAGFATITLTLTACGTSALGTPDIDAGKSSTSSGQSQGSGDENRLPHHGAPKVPKPVDISEFEKEPCSALTKDQLHTLGIDGSGDPEADHGTGAACDWGTTVHHGAAASITYIPNPGGLSDLYAINKQQPDKYAVFKPSPPVNGFPSVLQHVDANEQENGICNYLVGMNDRSAVAVAVHEDPGGDPCDDAKTVAAGITKTMKDGSR